MLSFSTSWFFISPCRNLFTSCLRHLMYSTLDLRIVPLFGLESRTTSKNGSGFLGSRPPSSLIRSLMLNRRLRSTREERQDKWKRRLISIKPKQYCSKIYVAGLGHFLCLESHIEINWDNKSFVVPCFYVRLFEWSAGVINRGPVVLQLNPYPFGRLAQYYTTYQGILRVIWIVIKNTRRTHTQHLIITCVCLPKNDSDQLKW